MFYLYEFIEKSFEIKLYKIFLRNDEYEYFFVFLWWNDVKK